MNLRVTRTFGSLPLTEQLGGRERNASLVFSRQSLAQQAHSCTVCGVGREKDMAVAGRTGVTACKFLMRARVQRQACAASSRARPLQPQRPSFREEDVLYMDNHVSWTAVNGSYVVGGCWFSSSLSLCSHHQSMNDATLKRGGIASSASPENGEQIL